MSAGGRPAHLAGRGAEGAWASTPGPARDARGAGRPGTLASGGEDDGVARRGALRTALSGLTTRGRSFLAAGMAAALCAYALGQSDLLRVGLLLAALPLVCVLALYRTRYRVAGSRRLTPSRVPARTEARVHLRIDNVSRLPAGLLMLQDSVPYVLGPRPRFVLERIEAGGRREVSYRVRSDMRGSYPLGPLQLRLTDPFGMCELTRAFSAQDTLKVVPHVEPLPPVLLTGDTTGYGDGRQRSLALAGEDDVIPRGYRHGDDLRRVHWRSTARYGQLMVRREEAPQRARCTVLLDTRRGAYQGTGPDSPFEWAVSGAASVCLHLLERGYTVRLLTDTGAQGPGLEGRALSGSSPETAGLLLDALAEVEHSGGPGLDAAYDALCADTGGHEGLLVAFLGELDEEQAVTVGRMRQRAKRAVALLSAGPLQDGAGGGTSGGAGTSGSAAGTSGAPGPYASPGTGELSAPLRVLREAGWTTLAGGPAVSLPALWHEADGAAPYGGSAPGHGPAQGPVPGSPGGPPDFPYTATNATTKGPLR